MNDLPAQDLEAYAPFISGARQGVVLARESKAIEPFLLGNRDGARGEAGGRGAILRFPLESGEGVLRTYRRGGLVARILKDTYGTNRMRREFEITSWLYARGAAVPEPLGTVWERCWGLYRGAIATRLVPGETLLAYLESHNDCASVLHECGRRIREMHDLGVWHADLQVLNILVGGGRVWLIDFDNARRLPALSDLARARNLLRLRRSLEKHGRSLDNFNTIREGYGKLGLPTWVSSLYRLRGMVSDALHR